MKRSQKSHLTDGALNANKNVLSRCWCLNEFAFAGHVKQNLSTNPSTHLGGVGNIGTKKLRESCFGGKHRLNWRILEPKKGPPVSHNLLFLWKFSNSTHFCHAFGIWSIAWFVQKIAGQKADMTSSEVQFGDHFVYDLVCLFFGFFTFFTFKSWVLRYVWKIM